MRNSPNMLKGIFATTLAGVLMVGIAGCNVGPNYKRPAYPTPPALRGADGSSVTSEAQNSLGDEQWSQVFREPELQGLIRTALANNYDLRIAAQRVLEQQAQLQVTRSQEFPQITVGGTAIGASVPNVGTTSIPNPLAFGSLSLGATW